MGHGNPFRARCSPCSPIAHPPVPAPHLARMPPPGWQHRAERRILLSSDLSATVILRLGPPG